MNIRKRKSNLAVLGLAVSLSACSSVSVRSEGPPLCSGKMAVQKFVWTVAASQRVPKGIELSRLSEILKARSELQDSMVDSLIPAFIFLSSNDGRYSMQSRSQKNEALNPHAKYIAEERSAALIETGPNNFIFCIWDECEGLKDPLNGSIVKKEQNKRHSSVSSSVPRPMYYVKGIVDPVDYKFDWHRESSYSASSPAYVDWKDYFERHPFQAGSFLANNYFNVPASKRKDLCIKAGFEENCFATPKYDFKNNLVTNLPCNIVEMSCRYKFALSSPFRYTFLMNNNGLCGTSCLDDINTLLTQMKDPHFKLKWEDAIAKDIFLKLSVSTTKKVEKDWVISRTEWNPSLFCQYARPNSDLFTQ